MKAVAGFGLVILALAAGCASGPPPKPVDPRVARAEADNAKVEKLVEDMDFAKAGPEAERVAKWIQAELGPDHPAYAEALANQGALRYYAQDVPGAKALFQKALTIQDAALPKDHLDRADSLGNLGAIAMAEQDHAAARKLYEESLAIRTKALGPEHEDVGDALHELAYPLLLDGEHERALELYRRTLDIWVKALGPQDRRAGQGHLSLAMALSKLGQTAEANKHYEQALAVFDKALTELHPQRIQVIQTVAMARWQAGQFAQSSELFEELLTIQEKQLGRDDPRLADTLDQMGGIRAFTGDYKGAARLHLRAVTMREKAHGTNHPKVAGSVYLLANQQLALGQLDESAASYMRASRIYEASSGAGSLEVAYCTFGLGRVMAERGDYPAALDSYTKSISVMEASLGSEKMELINARIALAAVLSITGEHVRARRILEACLAVQERQLGVEHPSVGRTLISLGRVALQLRLSDQATVYWMRALEIAKTAFGFEHPDVADLCGYLGEASMLSGNLVAAVNFYQQALTLNEQLLGKNHPKQVALLHNMAHVLAKAGHYDQAIEYYSYAIDRFGSLGVDKHPWVAQARCVRSLVKTFSGNAAEALPECRQGLADLRESLGPEHPWIADNLRCAILANWRLGKTAAAQKAAQESLDIARRNLHPILQDTSVVGRLHVVGKRLIFLFDYLSLFAGQGEEARRAYDAMLDWKGRVAESLASQSASLRMTDEPEARKLMTRLAFLRKSASELILAGIPQDAARKEVALRKLDALNTERDRTERELARMSSVFRHSKEEEAADSRAICRRLAPDQALVDFLMYERYSLPEQGKKGEGSREARYVAFVLRSGKCNAPVRIELGDYYPIDSSIAHYRELIVKGASTARILRQSRRIRTLVWDPLLDAIGDARRIWVVPDLDIAEVAFGSLQDDGGRFLIERLNFSYLSSAKDLVRLARKTRVKARGGLVAGGIDYGPYKAQGPGHGGAAERGGLIPVPPLEESGSEAAEVAKRMRKNRGMKVKLLKGVDATEQAVTRYMQERRFVHLATHGFFSNSLDFNIVQTDTFRPETDGITRLVFSYTRSSTIMTASGIALANANEPGERSGEDDGMLSAAEVASLDLSGADLVTLSACESGRGSLLVGQGVLGLRRAFFLAGARALVVSLWKVRDKETRHLMEAFYRHLAKHRKVDKAQALRAAKLEMIAKLRKEHGRADPRLWAAFILSGR